MKHWNYRVIKRVRPAIPSLAAEPEDDFGIYECYYDTKGLICSFSTEPRPVAADTLDELKVEIQRMSRAFKSPVLDYDKLPEPGALSAEEDSDDLPDSEGEEEIVIKP